MNPPDQRVLELVDKWLQSLELHLKYATLTDEAYWQVQPWVRHQRPTRWILDLAKSRALELKRHIEARAGSGDDGFAEALELMAFLANLAGAQNIERFIPLAEAERENKEVLGITQSTLQPLTSSSTANRALTEPTREMPMPTAAPPPAAATARPAAPVAAPGAVPPPAAARPTAKRDSRGNTGKQPKPAAPGAVEANIIADAVRLLNWGREWHELAEAIARIAGRPGIVEVRRCLRTHKAEIERAVRS